MRAERRWRVWWNGFEGLRDEDWERLREGRDDRSEAGGWDVGGGLSEFGDEGGEESKMNESNEVLLDVENGWDCRRWEWLVRVWSWTNWNEWWSWRRGWFDVERDW